MAVITLTLYGSVAKHEFISYDDQAYVTHNTHVTAGLTWATVRWSLTATEADNWHPVTWFSHALDCQLFGLWAGGHHLVSVLIHVLNVVLLFLLLRRATGKTGCSFFVAALFAWHPLNVESVAWVAERKNVLSTLFFLITIGAYGWYARKPRWSRYLVVAGFFVLGLAAKPMIVTLPFVLLLLDFWPLQRLRAWQPESRVFPVPQWDFQWLLLEKLPLLTLSAASSVITVIAQKHTLASAHALPFSLRLANTLYSYLMYVWKMLDPTGLAVFYPHPFVATPNHTPGVREYFFVAMAVVFLAGISFWVWRQRSCRPYLLVGWFWYLGTLVPVIGLVQVGMQGWADRYTYLPLIGLFVIVSWGAADLGERFEIGTATAGTAAGTVLLILCVLTFHQLGYWRTNYDIWTHTLAVTSDNFVADGNMANELMKEGRTDWLPYYQYAAQMAPSEAVRHEANAANLEDQGRLQEASTEFELVTQRPPNPKLLALAYANLGIIYFELGNSTKAEADFQMALRTDQKAIEEMVRTLSENVAKHPAAEGYLRLAFLLQQTGHPAEAREACQQAVSLKPDRPETLSCLQRLNAAGR